MRIFNWNLRDECCWLMFWTGGVGVYVCFIVALYPAVADVMKEWLILPIVKIFMGQFAPELMRRSIFDAFLALEFFGSFGILVGFYPLIFTSSAIAGEIERRTMEVLLAQPVSRSRVLLEKFAVISINLAVLCTVSFVILLAAIAVCVTESPSIREYAYIFFNSYFLLLSIVAFGFICSVLIGNQRATLTVSIGFVLFSFVFYKGLSAIGVAQWITRLTPFYYADPTKILTTGKVDWGDNIILALITAALLSAALVFFRRKDIAT